MKDIRVIYYMDPICSACWALSGVIRKLILEYGDQITFETRMGGLMPPGGWEETSEDYISSTDLAKLWDESSEYYGVPINGKVWLTTPLDSSYVAGIAYKSAVLQDEQKANRFLRLMQEKLFVESEDISNPILISRLAESVGLDSSLLAKDMDSRGKTAFQEDLKLMYELEVPLFPTLFFYNSMGEYRMLDNVHPYEDFEKLLLELNPDLVKRQYLKEPEKLLSYYETLTLKDYMILTGCSRNEAEQELNKLVKNHSAKRIDSTHGSLWTI